MPRPLPAATFRAIAGCLAYERLSMAAAARKCNVGETTIGRVRNAAKAHPEGYEVGIRLIANGAPLQRSRDDHTPAIIGPDQRIPAAARRALDDIDLFAQRYTGLISLPWQRDAAEVIVQLLESSEREYACINVAPGSGKSSWFTYVLCAWLTARDRLIRGLIGSQSQNRADEYLRRLKNILTTDIPIRAKPKELARGESVDAVGCMAIDYGPFRPDERTGFTWAASAFDVVPPAGTPPSDKEKTWTAFGWASSVLGWRGDFEIWDDVHDADTIRSDDALANFRSRWDDCAESRLEDGGLLVVQGQRLGPDDVYRYCLDKDLYDDDEDEGDGKPLLIETSVTTHEIDTSRKNKLYTHIVYRAHDETKCPGRHDPKSTRAWPDSCLLSPRRLSWKFLQTRRMGVPNYQTLYQQEDVNKGGTLVHPLWIEGGTDPETRETFVGCWDHDRDEWQLPANLSTRPLVVASVDPSPTKWWGVQTWAFEPQSQQRWLLASLRCKMDGPDLLDWDHDSKTFVGVMEEWQVLSRLREFPISHWIIEQNAAQRWLFAYDHVTRWRRIHGVTVVAHNTTKINKVDAEFGIGMLGPIYKHGRVRLPGRGEGRRNAEALVREAVAYPDTRTTDMLMAQWFFEFNAPRLVRSRDNRESTQNRPAWLASL